MPVALLAVAAVGTLASMSMQKQAADKAALVDKSMASYNAGLDRAKSKQIDLDTIQNIRTQREEGKRLLSSQEAAYASSGVLATTGSPMHVQVTNAGRIEQRIQQEWTDLQFKQQMLESEAQAGVYTGEAQASADTMRGRLALVDGGAKLAGLAFQGYQAGLFGNSGSVG